MLHTLCLILDDMIGLFRLKIIQCRFMSRCERLCDADVRTLNSYHVEPFFLVLPKFEFLPWDLFTNWSEVVVIITLNSDQIQILARKEKRVPLT